MVGSSCVVRRVEAGLEAEMAEYCQWRCGCVEHFAAWLWDLSNGCGTCGEIGRHAALAVGMSAASAMGAKAIRPLVPRVP